ncbi:MAG: ORF6N domain-containing protein [Steroidobacteraceae bacterium]
MVVRGDRVLLDGELAAIYAVTTNCLDRRVNRNRKRLPELLMFQLTTAEAELSRSHIATLNTTQFRRLVSYGYYDHVAVCSNAVSDKPKVVVIAGPNGAGKSTTAPAIVQQAFAVHEFINADTIARGL